MNISWDELKEMRCKNCEGCKRDCTSCKSDICYKGEEDCCSSKCPKKGENE